jgi:hypothetical protein
VQVTGSRPKIVAAADGQGVVGHAGARLLADLADATGLTGAFSDALGPLRVRQSGHDPGRIAVDLAVMLADGGEAIADLAVLRNQADLFGAVASDPTAWRLLSDLGGAVLARLRAARAKALSCGSAAKPAEYQHSASTMSSLSRRSHTSVLGSRSARSRSAATSTPGSRGCDQSITATSKHDTRRPARRYV